MILPTVLGVYPGYDPATDNWPNFNIVDSLIVSGIAIVVVFAVLVLIIVCSSGVEKAAHGINGLANIQPRPENKILEEDEDSVVALLTATIDFNKETGKDCNLVKITKIDEE